MTFHDTDLQPEFDKAADKRPSNDETRYFAIAAMCGNLDYIQGFLQRYPDAADATLSYGNGWTGLMWAARYGQLPVIDHLLEKGARPEALNRDGKSVLDIASLHHYKNFAKTIEEMHEEKAALRKRCRDEEISRAFQAEIFRPIKAFKPLRLDRNH